MNEIKAPNGIVSYLETHYMVSSTLEDLLRTDKAPPLLKECNENGGVFDVMSLARELTDKFETEFQGVDWDEASESWLEKFPDWVVQQLGRE